MHKCRAPSAVFALVLLFPIAAGLHAQERLESGDFVLSGQIISPTGQFQDSFKVQLYHESQVPLAEYIVQPQQHFNFHGLSGGVYFVVADIPGFKKVRERIDINGQRQTTFSIILEVRQETVFRKPLDLTGGEDLVVNVADLTARSPELADEFENAGKDLTSGKFETARQRLAEIVRKEPEFYEARQTLGITYQKMMRYRDAEAEFKMAANLRPGLSAPWTNLGSLYLQEAKTGATKGQTALRSILSDALGSLLRAVELNPNAAFAHYLLGVAYFEAGFYEDAEASLIRSIELEPRLGTPHLALANVYIKLREWPTAMTQIDTYLKDPSRTTGRCHIEAIRSQIARILDSERGLEASTEASFSTTDVACGASDAASAQAEINR